MRNSGKIMILIATAFFVLAAASADAAQPVPTPNPKAEKKRQEIRKMAQDTLRRLYQDKPSAKSFVESSAGYAVFSNTGVKILVGGSGRGQGVAVNRQTGKEIFMKMLELQAGLGFGVKKFRLVFVFENAQALSRFTDSGWDFGGQADAAAKAGEGKGASGAGAVSVADGVWLYQLTDKGVALELTVKGSKYSKDDDLN